MGRSQRRLWKWTVIQVWPEGRKEDWVEASWLWCISTESSARPLERPQTIVRAAHLSQTWSCLSIPPCSCAAWPQHQTGMDFRAQQYGLWVNQSPTIRGLRPCSWLPRCPQNTPAGQPLKAAWALVKAAFLFSWHLSLDEPAVIFLHLYIFADKMRLQSYTTQFGDIEGIHSWKTVLHC